MNNKWIRFTLPNTFSIDEIRKWCELNCKYKFKIKNPKGDIKAIFQDESDALAFKLSFG